MFCGCAVFRLRLPCSMTGVPVSCGAQVATARARSLPYVLLTWGIIVAHFLASDYIYINDFPHWQCYAILGALWLAIYRVFDNTRQVAPRIICAGLPARHAAFFGTAEGLIFTQNCLAAQPGAWQSDAA